jgi:hypothetical protein
VLFAHALGSPKEDCLIDNRAQSELRLSDTVCQMTNGLFHVPVTNTGSLIFQAAMRCRARRLRRWCRETCGDRLHAGATLAHELGHTFGFVMAERRQSKCKPNYLSVMN